MSRSSKGQWRWIILLASATSTFVCQSPSALAQDVVPVKAQANSKTDETRKLRTKVAPVYPQAARNMHVAGTVRVMVVITPGGAVKTVKALGGHPVLLDSVMDAVKHWKYEPGPQETTTVVEFRFFGEGS